MSRLHISRSLPRRAAYLAACVALGASVACFPATALASQPDTDIICGAPESERQDAAEDRPDISARNAIVVGQDGTIYYERDADKQVKIASITKVMTAIVALENSDLDDEVVVDHEAATVGQSSADLREGDVLTMEEALRALLIPSGNDAGMAIASTVGAMIDPESDDPFAVFIQAMNDKAAELGMDSKFTNPHGLDFDGWEGDMHSSARDVATMFAYAMKNDTFRSLTSSDENVIEVTGADGEERQDRKVKGRVTVSFSLTNPVRTSRWLEVPAYRCEGGGEVVVSITVNRAGEVTAARIEEGGDDCMREAALRAANISTFNIDPAAPARHQGTITYTFIPQY